MKIPLFQVDAFTQRIFGGNPAAICPLERWLPDELMQAIAAENALAETAFFVREEPDLFRLRWFTPEVEVDLCGHATLATAFVLFNHLGAPGDCVRFTSQSGLLEVWRDGDALTLNFPSQPATPAPVPPGLYEALGGSPLAFLRSTKLMVVYSSETEIRQLSPNFEGLKAFDEGGTMVTAPGDQVDFVSRFFSPAEGIPEDPVTGSAHCVLTPYWAERLGKTTLQARQISARGGDIRCEMAGERVKLTGQAMLFMRGEIELADA